MRKEEKLRGAKGITLIALVITIIVLLILAGITIGALTGHDGIINQANEAKNATDYASWEEQIDVAIISAEGKHRNPTMDDIIEELKNKEIISNENQVDKQTGTITTNEPVYDITGKLDDYIEKIFGPGEVAEKNETYEDENGETATIPKGFEILPEADVVKDGLVIQDEQGNEFVWIPVASISEIANVTNGTDTNGNQNYQGKLYDFPTARTSEEKTSYGQTTTSYREPDAVSSYDNSSTYLDIIKVILTDNATDYTDMSTFKTTMQKDYNSMIKSVEEYGGFYIGRYEMSKSDSNTAQSKKNSVVLTADNDNTNVNMRWYGLYAYGKTYTNTANSVVSSMVWGSQYDAMMRWMQKNGEDVKSTTIPNRGTKNTNETITGPEGDTDIIRNVYDLYGGRIEWTLEANGTYGRVYRGRLLPQQLFT